ncbi:bifunctional diaminohydroxyphosphoribosylaminopyrimidine deaminase/5-amino-6-(5-phosphoribosylamino)uracil reductase RibD [Ramlibacter sp. AW1]|uniref:Riboflavin biosynthesis protein RibD n=1 Tax=Ramlibacter aurantiacus TaxID=2801330 RepID=A0A936ZND0_9BURK|nr:bifunctional diaminohydroxyphosphoribosylaminopyrimidine deaminase/5-amino-6-(5-phosphoribosylamino)uracil reductase RibD [Ramlibacter aurantiacus]MBL0420483.1 bifunctional diaminohydroxyphosphoribosylaminopyrimidine deaminase/5-amino-6-(5-phosphoribosylamino)uracil reductase RibD [Ramlibacter aurantiacus]
MPQPPALPPPIERALVLARNHATHTPPNPSVGCVITAPDGTVLGEGHTQPTGGPHAEVMALRDAASRGHDTHGATAWVTLEPCSHVGRTGPCCEALVTAGIARVVASVGDPNPRVAGRGFQRLRQAGVEVEIGPGAEAARELNLGFFSRMVRGMPWVRMKIAASLDGTTALSNGTSQWITSEAARRDGHGWRARAGAVLTGIGTVLEDDPMLDVRLVETTRQPLLVVVDSRLELPPGARLLQPGRAVLVYTASDDAARRAALEAQGATVVSRPGVGGKVDLAAMLRDLAQREVNELHVEAGHKLNGSLVRDGLVDEFLVYLAPRLLGAGRGMAAFGPLSELGAGIGLSFLSAEPVGPDLRIVARVAGRDAF